MSRMKGVKRIALAIVLLSAVCGRGEEAQPEMLPQARGAYEKGLAAAHEEDWDLAIGSFAEAQEAAAYEPRILYCLGLAHARAGHPLAAAAWFEAYLAAAGDRANVEAIGQEIYAAQAGAWSDMKRVFEAAKAAARKAPDKEITKARLAETLALQALSGDKEGAEETAREWLALWTMSADDTAVTESYARSVIQAKYAQYLAETGEADAAAEAAGEVEDDFERARATLTVARSRTLLGDFEGCRDALEEVETAISGMLSAEGREREKIAALMIDLAEIYEGNGQLTDRMRAVAEANRIVQDEFIFSDVRSRAQEALAKETDMDGPVAPEDMDIVREWTALARETSVDPAAVDLKGGLEWAGGQSGSDGIAEALSTVATRIGRRLKMIQALESRCATRVQPAFAVYLVLDEPGMWSREMKLVERGDDRTERSETISLRRKALVDDTAVLSAAAIEAAHEEGGPRLEIRLTDEGSERFAQATEDNVGSRLAVVIDGMARSAPVISERIAGGTVVVTGPSGREAKELAAQVNEAVARRRIGDGKSMQGVSR